MAFLPGFILWPLGSLIVGGIAGGAIGSKIGHRDVDGLHTAIISLNTTGVDQAAYRSLEISASSDLADPAAVFSHAGGETEGQLTGYPVRSPSTSNSCPCGRWLMMRLCPSRVSVKTA